nr:unnamed protein product [Spirometra erinaceieuropaei]
MDDSGVLEILGELYLTLPLLEELRQMIHVLWDNLLLDLSNNCVRSGRFPLESSCTALMVSWREGGKSGSTLVSTCGRRAIAASEMVERRLRTLLKYSAYRLRISAFSVSGGTAVGAEKRCRSFGCGTVDSLDRGEKTLQFVAIRVISDLLGLANLPSVLHLAETLLHKSTTMVEGCFVVVGGASDVSFVQPVLLGKQVADGGVVVIKPVLVLAL